jgi:hypothetical protein
LSQRLVTLFQPSHEEVFLFNAQGAFSVPPDIGYNVVGPHIPRGTWALVDADASFTSPAGFIVSTTSPYIVVLAASPRMMHWDSWSRNVSQKFFYMKPWTLNELIQGYVIIMLSYATDSQHRISVALCKRMVKNRRRSSWRYFSTHTAHRRDRRIFLREIRPLTRMIWTRRSRPWTLLFFSL